MKNTYETISYKVKKEVEKKKPLLIPNAIYLGKAFTENKNSKC